MAFEINRQLSPESVHIFRDEASGLDAVIALHSTALGPAAGGCRLWHYVSSEDAAADACRLAEGMSYKNALAGAAAGRRQGGAAAARRRLRPPQAVCRIRPGGPRAGRALCHRRGCRDERGRYADGAGRDALRRRASSQRRGTGRRSFALTARGVFLAMQAAAARRLERGLNECTVAIQGVGHVGSALAGMLHAAGAKLIVADMDAAAVARVAVATGAQTASLGGILSANADIFAPCALGGVLNHASIGRLSAKVVCGAANNQLATPEDGARLADRGVLYAPDYVVNAGGIINVAAEYLGWSREEAAARVEATPERLLAVLDHAEARGFAANRAADQLARAAIAAGGMARRAA